MNFLEKDLEDIIYENLESNPLSLQERGLDTINETGVRWIKRQLHIGNYGITDIVTFTSGKNPINGNIQYFINVFELKKDIIDSKTFLQAAKYSSGIEDYLDEYRNLSDSDFPIYFNIILIGSKINLDDIIYAARWMNLNFDDFAGGLYLYTYEYRLDGMYFKSITPHEYHLIDKGF